MTLGMTRFGVRFGGCRTQSAKQAFNSNRLRWLGHVLSTPPDGLPRGILSSETDGGRRMDQDVANGYRRLDLDY